MREPQSRARAGAVRGAERSGGLGTARVVVAVLNTDGLLDHRAPRPPQDRSTGSTSVPRPYRAGRTPVWLLGVEHDADRRRQRRRCGRVGDPLPVDRDPAGSQVRVEHLPRTPAARKRSSTVTMSAARSTPASTLASVLASGLRAASCSVTPELDRVGDASAPPASWVTDSQLSPAGPRRRGPSFT